MIKRILLSLTCVAAFSLVGGAAADKAEAQRWRYYDRPYVQFYAGPRYRTYYRPYYGPRYYSYYGPRYYDYGPRYSYWGSRRYGYWGPRYYTGYRGWGRPGIGVGIRF